MAEIRYGHVEGPGKGKEYPMAASQAFHRRGGKFVYAVAGDMTRCATAVAVVSGWAVTPKDASATNFWTSSSTAGSDLVFVIQGLEDVFELPVDEGNASLAASYFNRGAGLVINSAGVQVAKLGGVAASPVSIVDIDTDNKTVRVKIKPSAQLAA